MRLHASLTLVLVSSCVCCVIVSGTSEGVTDAEVHDQEVVRDARA